MRGEILIEKATNRRSLYVPEAHIQFYVMKAGDGKWIVAAFRTDGYYRTEGGAIPTTQHLADAHQFAGTLEVPDHIVEFAVTSERMRQESVSGIEDILKAAVTGGGAESGWRDFQAHLEAEKIEQPYDDEAENQIGEEISALMAKAGGLL